MEAYMPIYIVYLSDLGEQDNQDSTVEDGNKNPINTVRCK